MADDSPRTWEFDCERLILHLEMTIPGDVSAITPAVKSIMEEVKGLDCGSGQEFEIETAIREALANAVVYGCEQDPSREAQVAVACDESRGMLIVVRDPGRGFDPAQTPSPIVGEHLYSNHGRGIFLINQFMDEVRFEKDGTEIWMLKK